MKPGVDYSEDLKDVPAENLERVKEAEAFVYKWCHDPTLADKLKRNESKNQALAFLRRNFSVSSQLFRLPSNLTKDTEIKTKEKDETIPKEWETAYDMRPWPDYPDQPSRS